MQHGVLDDSEYDPAPRTCQAAEWGRDGAGRRRDALSELEDLARDNKDLADTLELESKPVGANSIALRQLLNVPLPNVFSMNIPEQNMETVPTKISRLCPKFNCRSSG